MPKIITKNSDYAITDSDVSKARKSSTKKLEKDIQKEICDWLALKGFFFWRSNNIPVFGMSGSGHKTFRSMPKYAPKGLPDIQIIHRGVFIGLEVKVPDYWKFTDDQKNMRDKITVNGGFYYLVTSLQEAEQAMHSHSI